MNKDKAAIQNHTHTFLTDDVTNEVCQMSYVTNDVTDRAVGEVATYFCV